MTVATRPATMMLTVRDLIALTKPRITLMVLVTAAGGMWLAPGSLDVTSMAAMLLTTGMVVGAANTLNCYLERDSDRLMARTANRPLPDRRLEPSWALVLGVLMGLFAVPTLTIAVNPVTGLLGLIALISYVAIYTPMKQYTPAALFVGALPGALPPLMGWTAVTGSIDLPGLVLFGVLFFWQIPHFIAISIFRQEEYERAGLKVLPSVRGVRSAKVQSAIYAAALWAVSLLLVPYGLAGAIYLVTAVVVGGYFFWMAIRGFKAEDSNVWAKKFFVASLIYLTALFAALIIDAL
ncbi:MAG: protoheme IX farnesyltransferase [Deltaproteobacteria bacterium]|nr:MAG: protoheme IX farnesyltransferase [Deltaproteobacteria bacterium]